MTDQQNVAPAADQLPAGWPTAPAPPAWVTDEHLRDVADWRNLGERRWAGRRASVFSPDLLLLLNEAGTGFARFVLDLNGGPDTPEWLADRVFGEMQVQMDHEALPECAKPDCSDKAPMTFTAAEPGPLAGRQREPGERIYFCNRHGNDVWCAASGGPVADWLKPDAVRLDPIDALWAAGFANDTAAYAEAVDRLRKLTGFSREPEGT
jgi:hypothetical protein